MNPSRHFPAPAPAPVAAPVPASATRVQGHAVQSVLMTIVPLPPVLSGVDELRSHLKLPTDFMEDWVAGGTEGIPAIPHVRMNGRKVFFTAQVMDWMERYHGCGGETGREPTRKSKVKLTPQARRKLAEEKAAAEAAAAGEEAGA